MVGTIKNIPADVEIFVEEYAEAIADQLADDGLIKEK